MADMFELDDLIGQVRRVALEDGGHVPMVFAFGRKHAGLIAMPDLPDTHDSRRFAMYMIGYQVSREGLGDLLHVVFVSEGWMSWGVQGEAAPRMMPSQDPNRIEVIIINHRDVREHATEMVMLRMVRNEDHLLVSLEDFIDTRTDPHMGTPESPLLDSFIRGYQQSRKGRRPRPSDTGFSDN